MISAAGNAFLITPYFAAASMFGWINSGVMRSPYVVRVELSIELTV
jgi:hypothetical protein